MAKSTGPSPRTIEISRAVADALGELSESVGLPADALADAAVAEYVARFTPAGYVRPETRALLMDVGHGLLPARARRRGATEQEDAAKRRKAEAARKGRA